jgi:hypothetical protein
MRAPACAQFLQLHHLVEQQFQHEPMVLGNSSLQRDFQFGDLGPQLAAGQLGQHFRIVLTGDDGLEHVASGQPQDIRGHRRQLEVGVLQDLLQTVGHVRLLVHQLHTLSRQFAQFALLEMIK